MRPVILKSLRSGGLVILPTETSYMLAGDARNHQTIQRLRRLKSRPAEQNMSVIFSSVSQAENWTIWNENARMIGMRYLPGPLTLILPLKEGVSQYASDSGNLGVRIPGHPFLLNLFRDVDFPVTATSANPHGSEEPYETSACVSPVDVVWDAGKLDPEPPSTILDLSGVSTEDPQAGSNPDRSRYLNINRITSL